MAAAAARSCCAVLSAGFGCAAVTAEAARVAVAVQGAFDGFNGFLGHDTDGVETDAMFLDDDSTGYEDDLQVYRRDLVFWIQHTGR